jgi:hypothetical protein
VFKAAPNDDTGLKLPGVDGGRVVGNESNGENASSKVEADSVVVGDGSSMSDSVSTFVLAFLHLAKGLNRLVHCRGEGSESQMEADERKDLNEWRSFISTRKSKTPFGKQQQLKTLHFNLHSSKLAMMTKRRGKRQTGL